MFVVSFASAVCDDSEDRLTAREMGKEKPSLRYWFPVEWPARCFFFLMRKKMKGP